MGSSSLDALFGQPVAAPVTAPAAVPRLEVYNKHGLHVYFEVTHPGGNAAATDALAHVVAAPASVPVQDVLMRVAVPRWLQLRLEPASASALTAAAPEMTQAVHLLNTAHGTSPVLLRVQFSFRTPAHPVPVDETVEIAFPPNM